MLVGEGGQKPICMFPSEVILLDGAKLNSTNPQPNRLQARRNVDRSSPVARGSKVVVTANNLLPQSRAVLSAITNHNSSMATLGRVIATLTKCERKIAIAMAAAEEQGLPMRKFPAKGYHGWICTVRDALICMKKDFAANPTDIMHLVNFRSFDPEYKHVSKLLTTKDGIAEGGLALIIWILSENPAEGMLSPILTKSGVYEPWGYYLFKRG